MLIRLKYILKYYLFWMLFFALLRLVFVLYYFKKSFPLFSLWDDIFYHSFRLDLSAGGYFMLFPMLVLIVSVLFPGKWAYFAIKLYTLTLGAFIILLATIDLISYGDWGFRLDATPLFYLSEPKAAAASASVLSIGLHFLLASGLFCIVYFIYRFFFRRDNAPENKTAWWFSPMLLLITGSLFFPIRGGMGTAPINVGSAYFSDNAFANHAAVNLPWNIGYSITNMETVENPYRFMDDKQAGILKDSLIISGESAPKLLNNPRPNIILVILESFTANAIGCLNGLVHVTPRLDKISEEGILFTRCYASGNRTDKGMVAIMGGYPSQPLTSIIKFPNKTQSLPALPRKLRENGYNTSFYYGGDIEFANYKSYMLNAGFETIVSLADFPKSQRRCSWGVPDEDLFQRVRTDIKNIQQPYLVTLFTLSSHPPFDVPMKPHLKGNDTETRFCNSVYYTDSCLGVFIDSLQKDNMLKNTLIILTADHGSTWPGNFGNSPPEKFHIPMVWYGGALSKPGMLFNKVVNQTDIAKTLLDQLGIDGSEFWFGKNIFAPDAPSKTIYAFTNGYGYVSDSLVYFYERDPDKATVVKGGMTQEALDEGKAFMQVLHNDLMNR
jgi:phosphoglycerol transferase MdoB-like AlkP superfamily enzyme